MHFKEVKTILTPQNGINIYRGCTNNCIFCDARSKCYRLDHEFTDIEVKEGAHDLLEGMLKKKRNKGLIQTGTMSDPYMDEEADLKYMRKCLKVIERFDFGIVIRTKKKLILRDIEILESINRKTKAVVEVVFSSADEGVSAKIDGSSSSFAERVEILSKLAEKGIPTIMHIDPILPGINDSLDNLDKLLQVAKECKVYGISHGNFMISVREGSREHFMKEIEERFPEMAEYYNNEFGVMGDIVSPNKPELIQKLNKFADANDIIRVPEELTRFKRVYDNKTRGEQLSLFDLL